MRGYKKAMLDLEVPLEWYLEEQIVERNNLRLQLHPPVNLNLKQLLQILITSTTIFRSKLHPGSLLKSLWRCPSALTSASVRGVRPGLSFSLTIVSAR